MPQQTIGIGSAANDGTGDPLRTAFTKVNANFSELYAFEHPGYIVNNWYVGGGVYNFQTGSAVSANNIRAYPAYVMEKLTVGALGVRINTAAAGGNVSLAIYAHNPATGRPTGTPLVSTASISTTSVGSVNAAASAQLGPGLYWFATNADNATVVLEGINAYLAPYLVGSATQGNDATSNAGISGVIVSQAFGTWPDLTSASFGENLGNISLVQFKVASVP